LHFRSHAFRALFSQSSEAAIRVNTQTRLQIWSYRMIISDSKEKQPVTNEGEQIISPVPCIRPIWFSSTVPQTAALNIM